MRIKRNASDIHSTCQGCASRVRTIVLSFLKSGVFISHKIQSTCIVTIQIRFILEYCLVLLCIDTTLVYMQRRFDRVKRFTNYESHVPYVCIGALVLYHAPKFTGI